MWSTSAVYSRTVSAAAAAQRRRMTLSRWSIRDRFPLHFQPIKPRTCTLHRTQTHQCAQLQTTECLMEVKPKGGRQRTTSVSPCDAASPMRLTSCLLTCTHTRGGLRWESSSFNGVSGSEFSAFSYTTSTRPIAGACAPLSVCVTYGVMKHRSPGKIGTVR